MARTVNQVTLLGNLGKDAEIKHTANGSQVANFSVATERSWKDKQSGEWKKESTWTNCVMWGNEKAAEKLKKGITVHIQGRLSNRNYEDKDGRKVYVTEVVVEEIIPLDVVRSGAAGSSGYSGDSFDAPF